MLTATAALATTQHDSEKRQQSDRGYEVLCDDLGGARRWCFAMRTVIFAATLVAPPGTLTTKDAIAIASLLLGVAAVKIKRISPSLEIHLVRLHVVWNHLRANFAHGAEAISSVYETSSHGGGDSGSWNHGHCTAGPRRTSRPGVPDQHQAVGGDSQSVATSKLSVAFSWIDLTACGFSIWFRI